MAFDTLEESVEDAQPVELFKFSNLEDVFTYTSGQIPVIFMAETYTPRPVTRGPDDVQTLDAKRQMVVKMPVDDPFIARYIATLPATQDQFQLWRLHTSDTPTPEVREIFCGKVSNVAISGNEALVNILSFGSILGRTIPQQTTRNLCNHVLYDTRCKVVDTSFSMATTVTSISSDGLTITIDGGTNVIFDTGLQLSAQLTADAAYFDGGLLQRSVLEARMARSVTDVGGNVADIVVLIPFATISVGSTLDLFAGCDHQFPTCRTKFTNQRNYGGFPYVPTKNPFVVGVES